MEQDGNVPESRADLVLSGIWRGGLDLNASRENEGILSSFRFRRILGNIFDM
jgi:hypothetical protein